MLPMIPRTHSLPSCMEVEGYLPGQITAQLHSITNKMEGDMYYNKMSANLLPSTTRLNMCHGWVTHRDNNPQHTAKVTKEWLKKKHI